MTTFCSFIKFQNMQEVLDFGVLDAVPEREDDAIGQLPGGTLVYGMEVAEEDEVGEVSRWLIADISSLELNEADAKAEEAWQQEVYGGQYANIAAI